MTVCALVRVTADIFWICEFLPFGALIMQSSNVSFRARGFYFACAFYNLYGIWAFDQGMIITKWEWRCQSCDLCTMYDVEITVNDH
jgi:hypothetical protein